MRKWAGGRTGGFAPRAYLTGQVGELDAFYIELRDQPLTIGRGVEANLQLSDDWVSRLHCEIWPVSGGHHIKDLSSRNGTWLNEWPVREAPLCEGDRIRVGNFWLRYGHEPLGRQLRVGESLGGGSELAATTPLAQVAVHAPLQATNPTTQSNFSSGASAR